MLRFVLKKKDSVMEIETVDIIVPELERFLRDAPAYRYELVGIKKLPSCHICFDPKCQSDHK